MTETEAPVPPPTKEKLVELTTAAALQYSLKNYNEAAEIYSQATEIQAELNGEMAPENAELLYLYGRCLYKVAVAKSDVLGGKVAAEEKKKPEKKEKKGDIGERGSAANGSEKKEGPAESKPFFQLTGDEEWTDSEDEEGGEGEGDGEEGEDDDFSTAYEILDLARVLLSRQLGAAQDADAADKGKGKAKAEDTPETRKIKERLADIHDLIAEISLENERYEDAIVDQRASLALRKELLPFDDTLVTEGHFKLSLALEFQSVAGLREAERQQEAGEQPTDEGKVDMALRNEAVAEMEQAVASLEARIQKEEAELLSLVDSKKAEKQASITDAKEMLDDMKQRIVDLKEDPSKQAPEPLKGVDPELFSGLLSGLLNADPAAQKKAIEEAKSTATDLTSMVRSKKKEKPSAPVATTTVAAESISNGKRKLEVEEVVETKRAKTEEMQ